MNYFKRYFLDIITKKFFTLSGRASRKEFWFFILFSFVISYIVAFIGSALGLEYTLGLDSLQSVFNLASADAKGVPINMAQMIFSLVLLLPSVAITTRRLHDIGKSGWWQLITLIPLIGLIILIIYMLLPSQEGANRYGAYPID